MLVNLFIIVFILLVIHCDSLCVAKKKIKKIIIIIDLRRKRYFYGITRVLKTQHLYLVNSTGDEQDPMQTGNFETA